MKDSTVAVIADIHANSWALQAVLADIERRGVQEIVNLGDSLDGPLDPAGTADLLLARQIPSIRGNGERHLLDTELTWPTLTFVRALLNPVQLAWIEELPHTTVAFDDLFLCHGNPHSDETYLIEEVRTSGVFLRKAEAIAQTVAHIKQPVILCAHSHVPRTISLPDGKLVINPGSVGLPAYDQDEPMPHVMEAGSPHARYALLSKREQSWLVEHILVPYDWAKSAAIAEQHQRLDWARWIATGRAE